MAERLLVVEDEETLRRNLARYLEGQGYQVEGYPAAEPALEAARASEFAVALIDLRLPGKDGLTLMSELASESPDTAVMMMTSYSSVESVIDALRLGAQDYLVKPVLLKDVGRKVDRLVEHRRLLRENARLRLQLAEGEASRASGLPVARSRAMQDLLAFVRQVAPASATVLIEGESGSGKEVIARVLHDASPRKEHPFVAANMSAIPENLVESHLFGHDKGAFTGADAPRDGLFRAAGGGTLFLDEIGELPLAYQAKLLRALEAREVYPVGRDRPARIECRVVAATNADLATLVAEKRFRSDLFYRLATIRVRVPPLRERPDDVPPLVQHFIQRHAREHDRPIIGVDGEVLRRLMAHRWPGNVRELSNVLERATLVCGGRLITLGDLPPELLGQAVGHESDYHDAMTEFERALIDATLERVGGDRREAARALGLSLATLYRRLEKLGLKERQRPESASTKEP